MHVHACVCGCMHAWIVHACVGACMRVWVCTCMHGVCMHECMWVCTCMHACMFVYVMWNFIRVTSLRSFSSTTNCTCVHIPPTLSLQEQFIFSYDAVLESVTCGDTQIVAGNLRQALAKLQMGPKFGPNGLASQFQVKQWVIHLRGSK